MTDRKPAETDEERADREQTERDHARGDHTHCGITCETEMPTEHLRNFVIAKGYPGTKRALDELIRRAGTEATAVLPAPAEQAALRERYATAIHNAMEPDLSLVDQEPAYQALIARAAEAAMALADAEQAAVLCEAADKLDRYVGKQSSGAAPEVYGARMVIRELRRMADGKEAQDG